MSAIMCPPRGQVCVHFHECFVCVHSTPGSQGLRSQYTRSCGHDAQAAQSAGSSFTTSTATVRLGVHVRG